MVMLLALRPAVCNQSPKECTRSQTYRSVGRRGRRKMNMWMQPQWLEKTALGQPIGQTPDGCRRPSQWRASQKPQRETTDLHTLNVKWKWLKDYFLCYTPLRQVLIKISLFSVSEWRRCPAGSPDLLARELTARAPDTSVRRSAPHTRRRPRQLGLQPSIAALRSPHTVEVKHVRA
jgi:hypothetical protein